MKSGLPCLKGLQEPWCELLGHERRIGNAAAACTPADAGPCAQACCTEAGMFALRERRVHVTQARTRSRPQPVGTAQDSACQPSPLLAHRQASHA